VPQQQPVYELNLSYIRTLIQEAFFALPGNSGIHEILIILAPYVCIGFGDTVDLPFLETKKMNKIDTQRK